ncbi:hypothetical protein LKO27_12185 [Tessaracoccus sp. OS52]|uniref:hypothetical protein n=1 Tax=Tessaracoccus sp. OS52 TaxID=2886691 RepID=UPI001D121A77|nr:hypothetical protein [Tessaracoccus sp. OS52]MCC2594166.1 hypothetical protein [Tessaracoccus sp. OS52]
MKRLLSIGAAGALVLGASLVSAQPAHAATPPSYAVMLLQPTAGNVHSYARGLNGNGDVVGSSELDGLSIDGGGQSTLWKSRSGEGTAIAKEFPSAWANDISAGGTIVGRWVAASPRTYWYAGGTATEIQHDDSHSTVGRISGNGVAALNVQGLEGQAYVATSPTDRVELPPPAGTRNAWAEGVSDDGSRVSGTVGSAATVRPVVWAGGTPRLLQTPGWTSPATVPAVNNSGAATGCGRVGTTQAAFSFSPAGIATRLPALPGFPDACATAINDASVVAGTSSTTVGDASRAVIWLNGQVHDLNSLAAQRVGYTLTSVSDINASGQIVGTALLDDGSERGYIATPSTATSIYTAPGYHDFNHRQWRTTCEPYSQTTRCRTEIIATTVHYANGAYSRVTDWTFNNLTYNPSPRNLWNSNPLGNTGTWTASDGRHWRTECDKPTSGRNGCRSYAYVKVATANPNPNGGYSYTVENKWVMNNIVKFS